MRVLVILLVFFSFLGSALADTRNVNARSGRTKVLGHIGVYNTSTCRSVGVLGIRVSRKPKHGSVRLSKVYGRLSNAECKGKRAMFYRITYTARRGYRGSDTATVSYSRQRNDADASTAHQSHTFNISVR